MEREPQPCPISPNEAILIQYPDAELRVCAATDCVVLFPDPNYNHLRYWDPHNRALRYLFLGQSVLTELIQNGIPPLERDTVFEMEFEAYVEDQADKAQYEFDQMLGDD